MIDVEKYVEGPHEEIFERLDDVEGRVKALENRIVTIHDLPGYDLRFPLTVVVEPNDECGYMALGGLHYGTGASVDKAVEDYKRTVVENLELLSMLEDCLGDQLRNELAMWRRLVVEVGDATTS